MLKKSKLCRACSIVTACALLWVGAFSLPFSASASDDEDTSSLVTGDLAETVAIELDGDVEITSSDEDASLSVASDDVQIVGRGASGNQSQSNSNSSFGNNNNSQPNSNSSSHSDSDSNSSDSSDDDTGDTDTTEYEYEEDIYASDAGYEVLSENQQTVYDDIKEVMHEYYAGECDATTLTVTSGSTSYSYAALGPITIKSSYKMDTDDVMEVSSLFRCDNPIYFFTLASFLYSTNSSGYVVYIYMVVEDDFADSETCQTEKETILSGIEEALDSVGEQSTAYKYAKQFHNWILENAAYSYDEDGSSDTGIIAHSIAGVFDGSGTAVCEGYAKAFQILLISVGIDNYYVHGLAGTGSNQGGHAWNMVRLDDGYYYYYDLTWDDDDDGYSSTYSAKGETSFSTLHFAYTLDGEGETYFYDLPDVPDSNYSVVSSKEVTEDDFTYTVYNNKYAVLTAYTGSDTDVTIPSATEDDITVTGIQGAFYGNTTLETVTIPDSITILSYGDDTVGAFEGCTSLQEVTLTDSIVSLYYGAFYGCSSLTSVEVSESVTHIGPRVFDNCDALESVYIYNTECEFLSLSSLDEDITIYGYSDSTAETYADTYSRTFIALDEVEDETTTETTTTITTTTTTMTTTTTEAETTTTESTESTTSCIADANGDGTCDLADLVLLTRYLANNITLDESSLELLDVYQDGAVNVQDVTILSEYLLREIDTVPVIPET